MRVASLSAALAATACVAVLTAAPAAAQMTMPHGAAAARPAGRVVRESALAGTKLTYRLYSWEERNVLMKGMMGMSMPGVNEKGTHHLMVFISGADGKPVTGGKVGFQVTGPGGGVQKTLTMGMFDGYGADLVLGEKGVYTVRLKADLGGTPLGEEFTYEVQ
jgi:hypothetical protein